MIYPCARSFSRKKNKSGKSGEGNGAEVEGKEGSAESRSRDTPLAYVRGG